MSNDSEKSTSVIVASMETYMLEPPKDELQHRLQRIVNLKYVLHGVRGPALDQFIRFSYFLKKRKALGHEIDLSILKSYPRDFSQKSDRQKPILEVIENGNPLISNLTL